MSYRADLAGKIEGTYATLPPALGKAYGMVINKPMGVCAPSYRTTSRSR
jgi:succinate-semialdehyde dehydrogenase/glutarate-semialdehyde dehydrogenase